MTLRTSSNHYSYSPAQKAAVVRVLGRGPQSEIVLDDTLPFDELVEGVRSYLARNPGWFEGAKATLNMGQRVLRIEQVNYIKELLEREFRLSISGLWCGPESLEALLAEKGPLPVEVVTRPEEPGILEEDILSPETLLVKGTCRSGTNIHNNGNLIVLGDVNPGAEVTADGDIVVFGRLSGLAHAGVSGNAEATILALPIEARQVRIGPYVRIENVESGARVGGRSAPFPNLARVERGEIVIEPYAARSIWRRRD